MEIRVLLVFSRRLLSTRGDRASKGLRSRALGVYADGTEELYDHKSDRWEWQNLADNPEYAEVKQTMRQKLPTHHEPDGATYVPPNPNWGKQKSKSKK